MGAPTAVRSPEARRDVRRIYAWVALDSGQVRARSVIRRLDESIERLARRPRLGRPRPDFEREPLSFSFRPWLIVYKPLPEGDGILILPILDSRQDIAALLGKKTR